MDNRVTSTLVERVSDILFAADEPLTWHALRRRANMSSDVLRNALRQIVVSQGVRVYRVEGLGTPHTFASASEVSDPSFKFTKWLYARPKAV